MDTLTLRPMEADDEGWVEVVLVRTTGEEDDAPEGETVGYIREVEGTEDGPVQWYDVKVIDEAEVHHRRFPNFEGAVLAMGLRKFFDPDTRKLVGWGATE